MAEGFIVEQNVDGTVSVLRFKGGCDRTGLHALRDMLDEFVERADAGLVVDLAGVSFVDSSGVAYLLKTRRALRDAEKTLVLSAVPSLVRRTFATLGVDGLFTFADDEAGGVRAVAAG